MGQMAQRQKLKAVANAAVNSRGVGSSPIRTALTLILLSLYYVL